MASTTKSTLGSQRLLSLDFLRGFIMVLLMMSSTSLYDYLYERTEGETVNLFFRQFVHHPWNGLRFWDLVQPAFMFMAGTAMALSLNKQWSKGITWGQSFKKILRRCGGLFFLVFWTMLSGPEVYHLSCGMC
jgi:predicted acyltransferase